ncbi:MAG TPA: twin-arginine translocation signal domain-containing protein [Gemmatimonadaceae bacterium]|jgi:2'-hydroxyisoflavone reductase|nr:twin-arginine translocation signal domain-containing protein [Gemmatimonadaceae bacterium]
MTTRRNFIKSTAAIGGAMTLSPLVRASAETEPVTAERPNRPVERAAAPLNILILGGTGFTGPEQVEYAIARGHRVTLFNRGKTRPGLFKGKVAEELIGDLNSDTSALKGKQFDVVIDNPTTLPFWVKNAAQYLKGNVKHYIFISTTSVYRDQSEIGINENSPTVPMPAGLDPYQPDQRNTAQLAASANPANYGAFKARAEQEVQMQYPGINTVIRPCLIVGPLDRTDRFTYWPARIDKGGEVLAPDKPDDPCQFIDSRDLAEWTIRMAEMRELGTFNAIGPAKPMTIAEMLYGVKAVTTAGAQFTWVPWEFLQQQKVRPWRDMTVWQPPYGRTAGYQRRDASKAIAKGLTFRPVAVTAKDTLDWHKTRPEAEQLATLNGEINGLSMAREAEVLAAWKASRATPP